MDIFYTSSTEQSFLCVKVSGITHQSFQEYVLALILKFHHLQYLPEMMPSQKAAEGLTCLSTCGNHLGFERSLIIKKMFSKLFVVLHPLSRDLLIFFASSFLTNLRIVNFISFIVTHFLLFFFLTSGESFVTRTWYLVL